MRRTKAALIYRKTGNLRALQLLLGHTKLESTVRYLGIEVDDALNRRADRALNVDHRYHAGGHLCATSSRSSAARFCGSISPGKDRLRQSSLVERDHTLESGRLELGRHNRILQILACIDR
jgi:hypothetical protein